MEPAKVVLGSMVSFEPAKRSFRGKSSFSIAGPNPASAIVQAQGLEVPLDVLRDNADGMGAIGFAATGGSVARSLSMVLMLDGKKVPAFSLEALRLAVEARGYLLKSSGASGESGSAQRPEMVGVRVGPLEIPLSPDGSIRVYYAGHQAQRVIPAWQVMTGGDGNVDWRTEVMGRIVLVGSSAPGISQAVNTPIENAQLGVEVHAEVIEQILTGDYLTRPYWALGGERVLVVFFGVIVTLAMAQGSPVRAAVVTVTAIVVAALSSWYSFFEHGFLFGPVYPILGSFIPFSILGGVNYARTDSEKRAIRAQFEHFLAPEVIAEIAENPGRYLTPGGEERELSIIFCDVRGFSTITENMPPQKVIRFVNRFLTPISEAVIDHHGTIDKYIGDAVMAFWNAPRQTEDYRTQAVQTVFAIRRAIDVINSTALERGEPEIDIGVGLNNGACSVGAMGSERRLEYSCIGDPVNMASRLEGLTKQYGVWNCVGAAALEGVAGVLAVELDLVVVKGYTRPTPVWSLLSDAGEIDPELALVTGELKEARAAFLDRRWDDAEKLFQRLAKARVPEFDPAKVAANYLARIADGFPRHRTTGRAPLWRLKSDGPMLTGLLRIFSCASVRPYRSSNTSGFM
jgi:adenylate cyclase